MIKLFSEKVEPTFTSSNLNILTVKDFQEVFFDVFEFEINEKKFIAEKISEYKGFPVVEIPVVKEGRKSTVPFVLQRGEFEVLFNESNCQFDTIVVDDTLEDTLNDTVYIDEVVEESIDDLVLEQKESILEEIARARDLAKKHIIQTRKQQAEIAIRDSQAKEKAFKEAVTDTKKDFLEQFLLLTKDIEKRLLSFNQEERKTLYQDITEKVESLSDDLNRDIKRSEERAIANFTKKIDELTSNIFSKVLTEKIKAESKNNRALIEEKVSEISASIENLFESEKSLIREAFTNQTTDLKETINYLEKANIELNDKINKADKGVNKALSRTGNIKTQLEEKIEKSVSEIVDRMTLAEERVNEYYNERLDIISKHVDSITAKDKEELIQLVESSRNSLSEEIANIKHHVPNIIIEKSNGKVKEINVKSIKEELEKGITSRFLNEISSLKRLIELSSGGGSVAKQFADGGVMNGDLLIVGSLSAREYLGLGGVTGLYLPLSGGTLFGDLAFNTGSINNVNTIQFNTTLETIPNTGQIGWNTADGTLDVGLQDGTILPIGEKEVVYVKAKQNIKNGQCVYASGASGGGSGNIEVSLFSAAAGVIDELRFLGVATEDIAINGFGYVATFGKIKNVSPVDTRGTDDPQYSLPSNQGWTIGTILYISATSPGKYTSVPPTAPNLRIATAIVIAENGNQRILFVRAEHGYHLNELHDVKIVNPQNNQLLSYNKTLSTWENKSNITVNTLSATSIYALSSFVDVIDIKQYELSGFSVSGDVVINGNVSVTGTVDGRDVSNDGIKLDSIYTSYSTNSASDSFETVSKNLKSYPAAYNYSSGVISSIVYTTLSGNIVKTFNYTGDLLTSITLSGDIPSDILSTKTFTYSGSVLINTTYT